MENKEKYFKVIEGGIGDTYKNLTTVEVKNLLKEYISANVHLNVLLGSGDSLNAIPLMGTTFSNFRKSNPDVESLITIFKGKGGEEDNVEQFLSWLSSRIEGLSDEELILQEKAMKESLMRMFIDSIKDGFFDKENKSEAFEQTSENYMTFIRRIAKLKSEVKDGNNDIINLFTPNYDLFIEQSLDTLGYEYVDGFNNHLKPIFSISEYNHRKVDTENLFRDRWSPIRPFFRVYKLHGSLSWEKNNGKITKVFDRNSSNVLIAPTSSKYADSQGSPFSDLFREFSIELLRPNTVLIVNGYGFGDEHINDLIIQALGRTDFKLIAFVEEVKTKKFMDKVLGNAHATFITNPKNDEDGQVNQEAHYFKTLIDLLEFTDPFGKEKKKSEERFER